MANCWPSFKLSSHTELDLLVAWCCVAELYIKKRIDLVSVSCLTSHHQQQQSVANCFIRIVCHVCLMIGTRTAVCTSSFLRFGDELSEIGTKLKLPVPWLRGFMRRWGVREPYDISWHGGLSVSDSSPKQILQVASKIMLRVKHPGKLT